MLFTEAPLHLRPELARRAGFRVVESWWPRSHEIDSWAVEVVAKRLEVACLNCYGGNLEAGDRGFLNVAGQREHTLRHFEKALALARRVGAPRINVLIGRKIPDVRASKQRMQAVGVLRELACLARPTGIQIVVEPINRVDVPGYLVGTIAEALQLIEMVDSDQVRLLFDAYHVARSGDDPLSLVRSCGDLIAHVQYADCPGRGAPGTGTIDLATFIDVLKRQEYEGALGLEYDPRGPTEPTLVSLCEEWFR